MARNDMPHWPERSWDTPSAQFDDGRMLSIGSDVGDATASKKDLEDLLPMSGYCQIDGAGNPWTGARGFANQFLPLTKKLGESRGCEISSEDGIILNAVGQWRVEFNCTVEMASGTNALELRLEVFDPDGNLHSRAAAGKKVFTTLGIGVDSSSLYVFDNVVVDRPGYRVRVYSLNNGQAQYYMADGWNKLGAQYVYNGTPRFTEEG
ncbi:hypothetical protein [Corynebacterium nuruki]|uniref:hypothetical protein n=1 Tax=Corynebacterium nuruki TaxID=1032851 RepID=UPI0002485C49|nr:hypothetical protein [Corynebacterium nuruki]